MSRHPLNAWTVNISLAAFTLILFIASIYIGRGGELLTDKFALISETDRDIAWLVLTEIRLPRALLGLLVGAIHLDLQGRLPDQDP